MQAHFHEKLPPCHVEHVTRSALLSLLSLLLGLRGLVAAFRMGQRLWWLLFEFKPAGMMLEAVLMAVVESGIFLSCLISVLIAIAVLRLRFSHSHQRGRMLYRLERFMGFIYLLFTLFSLALTGFTVYGMVHYRLPAQWLGLVIILGLALSIACWVGRLFHRNMAKIMVDMNHCMRGGYFQRGGGVSCYLQTEGWLLAMFNLVPMAAVILSGVITVWFVNSLSQLIGRPMAEQLMQLLTSGATSVFSMYGVELLEMGLTVAAYAVTALLYGRYMRAHDERVPAHWHTKAAA